jgi:hypothetical protein
VATGEASPDPERVASGDQGTAELFAELAQVEGELRAIDEALAAAGHDRDQAAADIELIRAPGSGYDALDLLDAERRHEQARTRVGELLDQRSHPAELHARLSGIAGPLERQREEAARVAAAIEAYERLAAVPELLDKILGVIDAARPAFSRAANEANMPLGLDKLADAWRPDPHGGAGPGSGTARYRLGLALDRLPDLRAKLARLGAGLPASAVPREPAPPGLRFQYRVAQRYRGGPVDNPLDLTRGELVTLDAATAEWLMRDAPGVLATSNGGIKRRRNGALP